MENSILKHIRDIIDDPTFMNVYTKTDFINQDLDTLLTYFNEAYLDSSINLNFDNILVVYSVPLDEPNSSNSGSNKINYTQEELEVQKRTFLLAQETLQQDIENYAFMPEGYSCKLSTIIILILYILTLCGVQDTARRLIVSFQVDEDLIAFLHANFFIKVKEEDPALKLEHITK